MSLFSDNKEFFLNMGGILLLCVVLIVVLKMAGNNPANIPDLINDVTDNIVGGEKTYEAPPEMKLDSTKDYIAVFKTNKGDITVDLLEKSAPMTVNNFVFLAEDNFYNNTIFHRVIKDFIIQGGDRNNRDGTGGPGYEFADEINWDSIGLSQEQKDALSAEGYSSTGGLTSAIMKSRVLAMANKGANTNGSQFFFVSGSDSSVTHLNGKHTVFGTITEGWEIVSEIQNVEVDENDKPKKDIVVESIEIQTK